MLTALNTTGGRRPGLLDRFQPRWRLRRCRRTRRRRGQQRCAAPVGLTSPSAALPCRRPAIATCAAASPATRRGSRPDRLCHQRRGRRHWITIVNVGSCRPASAAGRPGQRQDICPEVSISGKTWFDAMPDGRFDEEPLLSEVSTAAAFNSKGQRVAITTTGPGLFPPGQYLLQGLPPDTYQIRLRTGRWAICRWNHVCARWR